MSFLEATGLMISVRLHSQMRKPKAASLWIAKVYGWNDPKQ